MLWSALLEKLSTTTRTRETLAEYDKLPKGQQDAIKDVGGFVGGTLKGGRRLAVNTVWRQIITLDADFADDTFQILVDLALGSCAYAIYSTHKHRSTKPRLRLVIVLNRPVTPDEYQAIARRLAADIGIDLFDDTTYQPHRLMYWPSTPADGEFVFEYQDGPWLDADAVLARYPDWQDSSYWPESSRANKERKHLADKQGDPLTKPGIIGAFCRTYSIVEVLDTMLADAYEPCAMEGRYTYKAGSTTAGLIVYEDKFAYSHHGTDPISGKLVNAFDLVRLHKFGSLDEEVAPSTSAGKLPSYKAMADFATKDDAVKRTIGEERLAEAGKDFANGEDWLTHLEVDKRGNYQFTPQNAILILQHDPNLAGKISKDNFAHRIVITDDLPWRKREQGEFWNDDDEACLYNYFSKVYGITGQRIISNALKEVLMQNQFHPVRDYLSGLWWDGEPRIDRLFIDYLGAEDTAYTRTVTRKMLVAAVARVSCPGVKFDEMLVLVGRQGAGKSYILQKLGKEWFSDSLTTVQGKEAYEILQGTWIVEMGELSALKKAEVEAIKQFLSKRVDKFRVSYGHYANNYPRQCVFFGSTNREEFLRDVTGNRRFWPVKTEMQERTKNLFNDLTDYEIDQVWAEAAAAWQDGETLYLDAGVAFEALKVQELHMEESDKFGQVQEYLSRKLPIDWEDMDIGQRRQYLYGGDFGEAPEGETERTKVCVMEVWVECFNGNPATFDMQRSREIKDILHRMPGWGRYEKGTGKIRFGKIYGPQRAFVKENSPVSS
jgi:predicted P-loop ATPase